MPAVNRRGSYFSSRRGSYIAEAAVVLPFVILAVITVVLIIMFFYASSLSQCRMHMALRCEAGLISEKCTSYAGDGTALSPDAIWDGHITSSGLAAAKRVTGSADVSMVSRGLLSHVGRRHITGGLRVLDPVGLLRIRQAVGVTEDSTADDAGGGALDD